MTYSDGRTTYRIHFSAKSHGSSDYHHPLCSSPWESSGQALTSHPWSHASGRLSGKPHKGKAEMQPNLPTFVCRRGGRFRQCTPLHRNSLTVQRKMPDKVCKSVWQCMRILKGIPTVCVSSKCGHENSDFLHGRYMWIAKQAGCVSTRNSNYTCRL